jgi:hypothetical protein
MAAAQLDRSLTDQQLTSLIAFLQTLTGNYCGSQAEPRRESGSSHRGPRADVAGAAPVDPQAELFDRALVELDHFATIENALYRDVFTARAGTLHNYDPLVREIDAPRDLLDRLRATSAIDAQTNAATDRLAASVDRQQELVEHFKSGNAFLQNSLAFFGRSRVRSDSPDLDVAIAAAAATILHLTLGLCCARS